MFINKVTITLLTLTLSTTLFGALTTPPYKARIIQTPALPASSTLTFSQDEEKLLATNTYKSWLTNAFIVQIKCLFKTKLTPKKALIFINSLSINQEIESAIKRYQNALLKEVDYLRALHNIGTALENNKIIVQRLLAIINQQ